MKTETIVLLAGAGIAAAYLLGGKGGQELGTRVGQAAGGAVGGAMSGATEGFVSAVTIQPYEWAKNLPVNTYIPIVDDVAYGLTWLKNLGKMPSGSVFYEGILKNLLPIRSYQ